jgi:NAD(P)-dependent dehydrogenase (short-subunit alcohol dehydrogenase family)
VSEGAPSGERAGRRGGGRVALVSGSGGGLGTAIVDRLRADGLRVRTLDVREPADIVLDLGVDEIPCGALDDVEVCVSNAGITDILSRPPDEPREVGARPRGQPVGLLPARAGLPGGDA